MKAFSIRNLPARSSIISVWFRGVMLGWLVILATTAGLWASAAQASDGLANPLEPANTSSPRTTLEGFLTTMEERYQATIGDQGILTRYLKSGALFPDEGDFRRIMTHLYRSRYITASYLDLDVLSPVMREQSAWRLAIQLKEILDRLDLPPIQEVPDAAMMASRSFKKWRIPGSELEIALIESGPRAGEYLFTQATVLRIPEFYERIRELPYRSHQSHGLYQIIFLQPTGLAILLHRVVPPRWFYSLPGWTRFVILDQPLWRWFCVFLALGLDLTLFRASLRYARRRERQKSHRDLWSVLPGGVIIVLIPLTQYLMGEILRITPNLYTGMTLPLWGVFYVALTWVVWVLGSLLGEWLIGFERIRNGNTDAQLIRLGVRLVSTILMLGIILEGANRVGLPSYSVLTGLGIGGLAMALAGQQALANLLGSLIIMLEKPFRIGHSIRSSGIEGRVEDIGFRSVRLRTPENSLLIVPSAVLILNTIENLTLRKSWRVRLTLYVKAVTPMSRLRACKADIETLLGGVAEIKHETIEVGLRQIGLNGLELAVNFTIRARDESEKVRRTDAILCSVGELAEKHRIELSEV